ncbi:MAG: S9 family peptidase, partial [Bacteroides sp.]
MRKITLTLMLCMACLMAAAQTKQTLELKDVVAGKFRPQGIRNVVPMTDGEHYTQMNAEGTQITKYSFKTGKPVEVLFDVAKARECNLKHFDSYQFSPDG